MTPDQTTADPLTTFAENLRVPLRRARDRIPAQAGRCAAGPDATGVGLGRASSICRCRRALGTETTILPILDCTPLIALRGIRSMIRACQLVARRLLLPYASPDETCPGCRIPCLGQKPLGGSPRLARQSVVACGDSAGFLADRAPSGAEESSARGDHCGKWALR